jgi:hypothetical protein
MIRLVLLASAFYVIFSIWIAKRYQSYALIPVLILTAAWTVFGSIFVLNSRKHGDAGNKLPFEAELFLFNLDANYVATLISYFVFLFLILFLLIIFLRIYPTKFVYFDVREWERYAMFFPHYLLLLPNLGICTYLILKIKFTIKFLTYKLKYKIKFC